MSLDDRLRAAGRALSAPSTASQVERAYQRWSRTFQTTMASPGRRSRLDALLRSLAFGEVAYHAGRYYQEQGDLRTAAAQFRAASDLGVSEAEVLLQQMQSTDLSTDIVPPDDEHCRRRAFLDVAARLVMGVPLGSADPSVCRPLIGIMPGLVPETLKTADVDELEAMVAVFRVASDHEELGQARTAMITALSLVEQLRTASSSADVGRRLLALAAELNNLVGWALFDAGSINSCRDHFARALALATSSGDRLMAANVLYRMGRVYLHLDVPGEALKVFQLGQISAQEAGSAAVVALMLLNEAWAYIGIGRPDQADRVAKRFREELLRAEVEQSHVELPSTGSEVGTTVLFDWLERRRHQFPGPDLQDAYWLLPTAAPCAS